MQRNLTPLGGAVDDQHNIADIRGFEHGSADARLLNQLRDVEQSREIEASAHAAELPHFPGQFLLFGNPSGIDRGGKSGNSCLTQWRRGVSAQKVAESIELQHAGGVVNERLRHRNLCYRKDV